MTLYIGLAVAASLALWAMLAWAIWKWVPSENITWNVWCPVFKKEATVVVSQMGREFVPVWAGMQICDVKSCSLFGGQPVNCRKECLQRP
jgi:hypothetical protein